MAAYKPPMEPLPPPSMPDIKITRSRKGKGSELQIGVQWTCGGGGNPALDMSVLAFNSGGLLLDACNTNAQEVMCGAIRHGGDSGPRGSGGTWPGGFHEKVLIDLDALELYTPVSVLALVVNAHKTPEQPNPFQTQPVTSMNVQVAEVLKGQEPDKNQPNACGFCMATVAQGTGHSVVLGIIYKGKAEGGKVPKKDDPPPDWFLRQCGYPCKNEGKTYHACLPLVQQATVSHKFTVPPGESLVLKPDMPKPLEIPKGEVVMIPPSVIVVQTPPTAYVSGPPPPSPNAGARMTIGLGWQLQKKGSIDLDSSILMFDANDQLLDVVNFHNLQSKFGQCIQHRGDNLVGGGGGDDEKIDIFLNLIPPQCTQFYIVVNVYTEGAMFDSVNPAHIRLLSYQDKELLRYNLNAAVKAPCFVFAKVFRAPPQAGAPAGLGWLFTSVAVGCQGRVSSEDSVRAGCIGSVMTYGPTAPRQKNGKVDKKEKKKKSQYPAVGLGLVAGAAIITTGATAALIAGYGPSFDTVGGVFADGTEVIGDGIMWAGEGIGDALGDFDAGAAIETIGDGAGDALGVIGDGAGTAWEWAGGAAGDAGEWIGGAAGDAGEWLGGAADTAGEGIGNAAEWVGDQDWGGHVATAGAAVGGAAVAVGSGIGDAAEGVGDALGEIVNEDCCKSICEFVGGIFKEVEKSFN